MSNYYAKLTEWLEKHGCHFVKNGKGSHQIWFSPVTNQKFTVPFNTNNKNTVRKIIVKDAGLSRPDWI